MASKASKRRRKRRRRQPPPASAQAQQSDDSEDAGAGALERRDSRAARPSGRRRGNIDEQAPPAPWGSFPLVELAVFIGLVMLVAGFLFVGGERGTILIVTGLLLASIGGLEVSIREHFAGFRSHTAILAGVPAAVVLGLLFYAGPDGLPPLARAGIGLAVYGAAAYLLIRIFQRRSGGRSFRFSTLRRR